MKKIISFFTILYLFANAAYAAPRHNKKANKADNLQGHTEIAANIFDATLGDAHPDLENAVGFGIDGHYYIFDNFALGADFSMNSNKSSEQNTNKVNFNQFGIYSKLYSQPFKIGSSDWRAYGVFGLATYGMEIKFQGGKVDDRAFGVNYGAGLMHRFTDSNIILNLEIRMHRSFQQDLSQGGVPNYQKAVYTNYGFNIGYRF